MPFNNNRIYKKNICKIMIVMLNSIGVDSMTAEFVRERITQLRLQKGVSEYKMSYDLGHSRGYINNISSGKSLPSMTEFFAICEYFGITPIEFFDVNVSNPTVMKELLEGLAQLDNNDLLMLLGITNRLLKK